VGLAVVASSAWQVIQLSLILNRQSIKKADSKTSLFASITPILDMFTTVYCGALN